MAPVLRRKETVSRETLLLARECYSGHEEILERYLDRLLWWNERANLVSRDVSRETVREHVVHSLLPSVMNLLDNADCWIDAGTGGGLPGIPLSLVGKNRQWVLNDLVRKKIAAVNQISTDLEAVNLKTVTASLQDVVFPGHCGVISKHAFKVSELLYLIREKPWKRVVMFKGSHESEIELESSGVEGAAVIYRFEFGDEEPFYTGKGLLVIDR